MRPGVGVMDSDFLKQRAAHCRFLAEKADPFIKRRLLDLRCKIRGELSRRNLSHPHVASGAIGDISYSIDLLFNAGVRTHGRATHRQARAIRRLFRLLLETGQGRIRQSVSHDAQRDGFGVAKAGGRFI